MVIMRILNQIYVSNNSSISIDNRLLNDENGIHAILWDTSNSTLRYSGTTKFDWKNLAMPTLGSNGTGIMAIDNSGYLSWTSSMPGTQGAQGTQGPTGSSAEIIKYQRILPTEGGTYSIIDSNSVYMNLNPYGSLNSFNVIMPPNPVDGQVINIIISNDDIYNWNIYSLNILANTTSFYQSVDNAAPTQSLWPHRSSSFMWVSIDSTWARIS